VALNSDPFTQPVKCISEADPTVKTVRTADALVAAPQHDLMAMLGCPTFDRIALDLKTEALLGLSVC
jgi:hypothetical protein